MSATQRVVLRVELDVDVDKWMEQPGQPFELAGEAEVPDDVLAWVVELVEVSRMGGTVGAVSLSAIRRLAR